MTLRKYPAIGIEPIDREFQRLFDAAFRQPAEAANSAGIEVDQRIVADQASRPPENVSCGESLSRPTIQPTLSRTWQTSSVPRLKIANAPIDRVQPEQYSIDAILDVEIGFALFAVAENV